MQSIKTTQVLNGPYSDYQASAKGLFFSLSKATLKLDLLSWNSEVKVPVVERKLIWGCISGHAVIQFSFQRYFHRRKFLWKISGSLIVNCPVFPESLHVLPKQDLECSFPWCRCVCRSVREHLDSSKKRHQFPPQFPEANTSIAESVEKYIMASQIDSARSGVMHSSWLSCGSILTSNVSGVVPRSGQLKELYSDLGCGYACGDEVI